MGRHTLKTFAPAKICAYHSSVEIILIVNFGALTNVPSPTLPTFLTYFAISFHHSRALLFSMRDWTEPRLITCSDCSRQWKQRKLLYISHPIFITKINGSVLYTNLIYFNIDHVFQNEQCIPCIHYQMIWIAGTPSSSPHQHFFCENYHF